MSVNKSIGLYLCRNGEERGMEVIDRLNELLIMVEACRERNNEIMRALL